MTLAGILRRSLLYRRARSFSALIALTVSAAVATALLTLYADLDQKLHHEFRSFGANIVVTAPAFTGDFESAAQTAATDGPNQAHVAAYSYAVATTDRGTPVVISGVDFPAVRFINPWWQVSDWPADNRSALVGERAAQFIATRKPLAVTFAGKSIAVDGTIGTLKTGGDEDSRIYLPQSVLLSLGVKPTVIEVQVPGGAAKVYPAIERLKAAFPGATVQPVRQLVEGESSIVDKTHALMFGAVLLIALTVACSVLATLSASVLERRRDFALMKALGGTELQMMSLFLLETLLLAAGGVLAGFVLGSAAAWAISEANFHTSSLPRIKILPLVILLNLGIAAIAALLPIRVLRSLQPAALLKGE